MFSAAKGLDYQEFLDYLHRELTFDWYLEVGSQRGFSLAKSRSRSIAVDPLFQLKVDVQSNKPDLHLFEMTSDDFFAAGHLKNLGAKPAFSFLDGMHLFEYLLRDVINAEAAGTAQSVIALHDCCPFGHKMTTRDLDNIPRRAWTGDVWKLLPILQEYRPDLTIEVLDCAPTGLVILSDLDPESRALTQNYDEILARYTNLSLADHGVERFFASFAYIDALNLAKQGFQTFRRASTTPLPAATAARGPDPAPAMGHVPRSLRKLSSHDVNLYFGHRVLRDFAADLAACIPSPVGVGIDLYVGVHEVQEPVPGDRLRIGIQTEQMQDSFGLALWNRQTEDQRLRFATQYDLLLDLSPDNAPAYGFLPSDLRTKLRFGPHIFPDHAIEPDPRDAPPLFFGALNSRRRQVIKALTASRPVAVAPRATYGAELRSIIADHGMVLNIHYQDGVYTEYPRLLKAYLAGKPFASEPLSAPMEVGVHYLDLMAKPTAEETRNLFRNLYEFSARHSLLGFLRTAAADVGVAKAG